MNREFKPVEELTFADDFMFGAVMRDKEICKGVIERLLKIQVDHIEYPEMQKSLQPYYHSRGARFDVYVKGSNTVFDIEINTYREEDVWLRTRYYQSILDTDNLLRGEPYKKLRESYILFISLEDPFRKGFPSYTLIQVLKEEPSAQIDDRTHKVVYNASAWKNAEDTSIRNFLRYVYENTPEDDFTDTITRRVSKLKADEIFKGDYRQVTIHDYDILERGIEKGLKAGREEGARANALENARNFLKNGVSPEIVAKSIGLEMDEVLKLQKEVMHQ